MSVKPTARRKTAVKPQSKLVKATILLDVETHTKLAAGAAMRRMDRSSYAASILREGLRGIVAFDRNHPRELAADAESSDGGIGETSAA